MSAGKKREFVAWRTKTKGPGPVQHKHINIKRCSGIRGIGDSGKVDEVLVQHLSKCRFAVCGFPHLFHECTPPLCWHFAHVCHAQVTSGAFST